MMGDEVPAPRTRDSSHGLDHDPPRVIAHLVNEFANVRVVLTASGGTRLLIVSERTGHTLALDPTGLEAIASLDHRGVSVLAQALVEYGSANQALGIDDRWESE